MENLALAQREVEKEESDDDEQEDKDPVTPTISLKMNGALMDETEVVASPKKDRLSLSCSQSASYSKERHDTLGAPAMLSVYKNPQQRIRVLQSYLSSEKRKTNSRSSNRSSARSTNRNSSRTGRTDSNISKGTTFSEGFEVSSPSKEQTSSPPRSNEAKRIDLRLKKIHNLITLVEGAIEKRRRLKGKGRRSEYLNHSRMFAS